MEKYAGNGVSSYNFGPTFPGLRDQKYALIYREKRVYTKKNKIGIIQTLQPRGM